MDEPFREIAPLFHRIFRSDPGEQYFIKRQAFEKFLSSYNLDLRTFIESAFGESEFEGTQIRKADLIAELLFDRLSGEAWRFIRDKLRVKPYLTDRRHTEEYAFDIALGWLEEEFVVGMLSERLPADAVIRRVGVDAAREYVLNPTAVADISVTVRDATIVLDLFVDHTGIWEEKNGMDLKKGKLTHFEKGTLDFVLGLDLARRHLYLVGPDAVLGRELVANDRMGGTKTALVPLGDPVEFDQIADRLIEAARSK